MTRKQVTWDMINKTARYFGWTVIDNGNFKQYRKDHEVIRIVKKGNLLKIVHITNGKITGQSGYDNELLAKITLIEYINLNLFRFNMGLCQEVECVNKIIHVDFF